MLDTQDLSLYQLNTALSSVESRNCSAPIKFFLSNVEAIRGRKYSDLFVPVVLIVYYL